MRYTTTTGIIIRKRNIGEQDQVVTFFSPELGKIEATARGARKSKSSFIGHIELLNVCEFQIYKSAHRSTLTQCQIQHPFKKVRENLKLTMTCFLVVEIFCKITPPEEQNQELYDLLFETFNHINQGNKSQLSVENFKVKILKISGALPDISRCGNCEHRWEKNDQIHINHEGEITCKDCAPQTSSTIPFKTMKLLHYLTHQGSKEVMNVQATEKDIKILKSVTDVFLHNYLPSELKTEKIIDRLHV